VNPTLLHRSLDYASGVFLLLATLFWAVLPHGSLSDIQSKPSDESSDRRPGLRAGSGENPFNPVVILLRYFSFLLCREDTLLFSILRLPSPARENSPDCTSFPHLSRDCVNNGIRSFSFSNSKRLPPLVFARTTRDFPRN